ncbi:MAG: helix-turn-helix transcriptional regulator [Oscillospiraceae bacterium]|nr:helix-turn-helix transcriptional regulator [Oscillospiraceae bacterium]
MESIALTEAVFYILISMEQPIHGYGIMQSVEKMSGGRVKLAAGTLYGALSSLVDKKWIIALPSEENSRKKEYQITDLGKAAAAAELRRLKELVKNGEAVAGGWDNDKNGI